MDNYGSYNPQGAGAINSSNHNSQLMHSHNSGSTTGFHQLLDTVISYLEEGTMWHRRAASECRRFHCRGWGRWHEIEAKCDSKLSQKLYKKLGDIPTLKHLPSLDNKRIQEAESYKFRDASTVDEFIKQFADHHHVWIAREKVGIECLIAAIKMANEYDTELYKCLLGVKSEVENEIFRVECVLGAMWLTNWKDIRQVSQELHEYFECKYDGGQIDFNVG